MNQNIEIETNCIDSKVVHSKQDELYPSITYFNEKQGYIKLTLERRTSFLYNVKVFLTWCQKYIGN